MNRARIILFISGIIVILLLWLTLGRRLNDVPKSATETDAPTRGALQDGAQSPPLGQNREGNRAEPYSVPNLPKSQDSSGEPNLLHPLTPEEEHTLKLTDYSAYVRYRANLEDPSRKKDLPPEQIIRERIGPTLKSYLEKQADKPQVITDKEASPDVE
ncbi:MAG: hypothetical protein KDD60_05980 [Bdellovibrionales bacterium]|nr:hypothetical protein [Bdellovibrionales bacterium]